MKYLLTGVAAIAMLTACAKKDKTPAEEARSGIVFSQEKPTAFKVQKGDPATAAQALAAMSLDTSGAGRVAWDKKDVKGDSAVFTDVTLVSGDKSSDSVGMHLDDDAFDLEGADLKAKKVQFEGLAMKDGKATFSHLVMSDVSLVPTDPDEAKQGSGKIGSIELVNPSPETAAWVASLFGQGEKQEMPEGAALSFDHWAVNDVDFRIDEAEGDKGVFTVNSIEVTGLKDDKAALMKVGKLDFDMTEAKDGNRIKMNLGGFEIHGANLKTLGEARDEAEDPSNVTDVMKLSNQDPADPGYESLSIDNFTMDMAGVKVDLPKLTSQVGHNKANSVIAVRTDPFKMTLTTGEGEFGEQLAGPLAMMGYETVELSGAGYQTYEPETDLTTYVKGQNYWQVKDGFRLDLGLQYAGAKAMAAAEQSAASSANPTQALDTALSNMILHNVELTLKDDGFVDRAFNAYATSSGQDPKAARNQVAGMLAMAPMMAGGSGIDMELINEASAALSSFISDPKTLTIKLKPKEPLAMSAIADMEDPSSLTKASLGFEASNK